MCATAPQFTDRLTLSISSLGKLPGVYCAGFGTTLVSATDWTLLSWMLSVVVEAWEAPLGSVGGCSSVWQTSSRVAVNGISVLSRGISFDGSQLADWCRHNLSVL